MNYVDRKKIVITGATSGVGRETAKGLARQGGEIIILARNLDKSKALAEEIEAISGRAPNIFIADLSIMEEVKNAAEQIKAAYPVIDILINNAGLIKDNKEFTKEGFESTLAVNHLAPFLLTHLLLPTLESASEAKIINVASEAHKMGRANLEDINYKNSKFKPMQVYGDTKLYNILFTKKLAAKYKDETINAYALHPGFVNSGFGHNLGLAADVLLFLLRPFMISARKGALTSLHVANLPFNKNESGQYYKNSKAKKPNRRASDKQLADQLWLVSNRLLQQWL